MLYGKTSGMVNLFVHNNQDLTAVEKLFSHYYPRLCDFAMKYLEDGALAEDVVQDVFVTICERKDPLPEAEFAARSYLYVAVRNACFNKLRHLKVVNRHIDNSRQQESEAEAPEILESIISSEVMATMMEAIDSLPEGCALVIRKGYLEGLSNTEIAQQLDISIHTVKSQKQRAISLLRDRLDPNIAGMVLAIIIDASC